MALTWSHLLTSLNIGVLLVSLALLGFSPAVLFLTDHGMRLMDKTYSPGLYEWYRGFHDDMGKKHVVRLVYKSANESLLYTAAAVGTVAGVIGVFGFCLTRQVRLIICHLAKTTY
jgi:hypothetical protein